MKAKKVIAWLIEDCPDFYYMPSTAYDQIFLTWDTGDWKCPAYWTKRGFIAIPLVECEDLEATHWIVNNSYGIFFRESRDACISLGKPVVSVKMCGECEK